MASNHRFPANERLYQQALEIKGKLLGQEHPSTAQSLNNLALLYESMGDNAQAESLYREALEIRRKNLELALLVQSQRQQLAMTQTLRYQLDGYLTLAVRSGEFTEAACAQVVAWKGMVLSRQQVSLAVVDHPELEPAFAELQSVASRLATLAFSTPEPQSHEAWQRQMAELSQRKERLESELSRKSAPFRQATQLPALNDVRAALPEDYALVDFLEYGHSPSKPPGEAGGWDFERRLLAFVIRREGDVELVELGPVALASGGARPLGSEGMQDDQWEGANLRKSILATEFHRDYLVRLPLPLAQLYLNVAKNGPSIPSGGFRDNWTFRYTSQ